MSTWKFDPHRLVITNLSHGEWEIDLSKVTTSHDLLFWILQAAQHEFNLKELFDEFRVAMIFCFDQEGYNGAVMLKELFDIRPNGDIRRSVNWMPLGVALKTAREELAGSSGSGEQ